MESELKCTRSQFGGDPKLRVEGWCSRRRGFIQRNCNRLERGALCQPGEVQQGQVQGLARVGPEETRAVIRVGLEHLPYEDRLRESAWFGLETRRLQGDLEAALQCLQGVTGRGGLFIRGCRGRMGKKGVKLEEGRFPLEILDCESGGTQERAA